MSQAGQEHVCSSFFWMISTLFSIFLIARVQSAALYPQHERNFLETNQVVKEYFLPNYLHGNQWTGDKFKYPTETHSGVYFISNPMEKDIVSLAQLQPWNEVNKDERTEAALPVMAIRYSSDDDNTDEIYNVPLEEEDQIFKEEQNEHLPRKQYKLTETSKQLNWNRNGLESIQTKPWKWDALHRFDISSILPTEEIRQMKMMDNQRTKRDVNCHGQSRRGSSFISGKLSNWGSCRGTIPWVMCHFKLCNLGRKRGIHLSTDPQEFRS